MSTTITLHDDETGETIRYDSPETFDSYRRATELNNGPLPILAKRPVVPQEDAVLEGVAIGGIGRFYYHVRHIGADYTSISRVAAADLESTLAWFASAHSAHGAASPQPADAD